MIHKIIGGKTKQKQRNIKNSIIYLLRKNKPEDQEFIKVLSLTSEDDLINFNKLISTKNLKSPYMAGVLSFEEKDIDETIKFKIIKDFEDIIFSGIDEELRPPVMWVQHLDKGRLELNYLTFNALSTGRSFPVYYHKTDKKLINDFTEIINYKNNFSSPFDDFSDVFKKHIFNEPGKTLPQVKKDFVILLNNRLFNLIKDGKINNKEELIKHLKEVEGFKINRISKNFVSIITSIDETPIRLKGDAFEDGRNFNDYFNNEIKQRPERSEDLINQKLNKHTIEYEKGLKARKERNIRIYINPINKKLNINKAVTLPEEIEKDEINRKHTKSEGSGIIEKIREIERDQQFISNRIEKARSGIDEFKGDVEKFGRRFGFFGDYFDRFSRFISKKLRTVVEFASTTEKQPEPKEKPIITAERKKTTQGRPRPGKRYKNNKEDDDISN